MDNDPHSKAELILENDHYFKDFLFIKTQNN